MTLAEHVASLCEEHNITHVIDPSASAAADLQLRRVRTPPVTRHRSYYIALHEIGHVVTHDPASAESPVKQEERAWRWALQTALIEPTEGVRRHIYRRLWSYVVSTRTER